MAACIAWPVFARTVVTFQQTILPGPNSVDVVDENGNPSEHPTIPLTPTVLSSVLGTPQQQLRIMNPARNIEWSVTVAPINGPHALWENAEGGSYDMNDSSIVDGPDADTAGGELSIDPSTARIVPVTNPTDCPTTDLSLGTASSFNEYNTQFSSISLVSGTARYAAYCGWDVSGIRVKQTVPPQLPNGTYRLHLVITIM